MTKQKKRLHKNVNKVSSKNSGLLKKNFSGIEQWFPKCGPGTPRGA